MRTIIIGGKSDNLGGQIASGLGGECILVSRSNSIQPIDITDPTEVDALIEGYRPNVIIATAGVDPEPQKLGAITDWQTIGKLLAAKSLGAMTVLNAAEKYGVEIVIFVGGSALSDDPRFCHFTIGNGALWAATQYGARHTRVKTYYFDLGAVLLSPMLERYFKKCSPAEQEGIRRNAISPAEVVHEVKRVVSGCYPSGYRIVLNRGNV